VYSLVADLASSSEPIPFQQPDSQFDVKLLIRTARALGIVPSLDATDEGYAKILIVLPSSAAAKVGVHSGDCITGLNEHTFERIEELLTVWSKLDLSEGLKLSLLRGGEELEATISAEVLHDLLEGEFTRHTVSRTKTEPHVPARTRPADRTPSSLPEFTVDGVSSYYMYSNLTPGSKKGLSAIIILGHPERRRENHQRFAGMFDEPVLLIWCDLFIRLDDATRVDDRALWRKKRREFVKLYGCYKATDRSE
jgi:hypothetical protein